MSKKHKTTATKTQSPTQTQSATVATVAPIPALGSATQTQTTATQTQTAATKTQSPATVATFPALAPVPECHTGALYAFTDPTTQQKYYGGGTSRGFKFPDTHAILVALDDSAVDTPIVANFELTAADGSPTYAPTAFIAWRDFQIPDLDVTDWQNLLRALRALETKTICFVCVGGHGRTGTALAIMAYLTAAQTDRPVEFIQSHYCDRAVDTREQCKYVATITGQDETAHWDALHPVKTFTQYAGSGWGDGWAHSYGWDKPANTFYGLADYTDQPEPTDPTEPTEPTADLEPDQPDRPTRPMNQWTETEWDKWNAKWDKYYADLDARDARNKKDGGSL